MELGGFKSGISLLSKYVLGMIITGMLITAEITNH